MRFARKNRINIYAGHLRLLNSGWLEVLGIGSSASTIYLYFCHLDINSKPEFGSNCAHNEAVGYIKGVCGIDAVTKPKSWAASNACDATKRLLAV